MNVFDLDDEPEAPEHYFDVDGRELDTWGFFSTAEAIETYYGQVVNWIVDGVIAEGRFVIFGPSGHQKSVLALELANDVALGRPFLGRSLAARPVVYVAAEEPGQFGVRQAAFRQINEIAQPVSGLIFQETPFDLLAPREVDHFIEDLRKVRTDQCRESSLVIIDPFAECFSGDENNGGDVGRAMSALRRITREAPVAGIGLVHHTGKDGADERGHSRLRGAMTSMLKVREKSPNELLVDVLKQRNGVNLRFKVRSQIVTLPNGQTARAIASATDNADTAGTKPATGGDSAAVALKALQTFGAAGAKRTEWRDKSELRGGTFDRAVAALVKTGAVAKQNGRFLVTTP